MDTPTADAWVDREGSIILEMNYDGWGHGGMCVLTREEARHLAAQLLLLANGEGERG